MMQSQFDFALAAPEIFLTVMGMLILVLDAFSQAPRRALAYGLTLATLAILFVLSAWQWSVGLVGESFFGLYVADPLAHLLGDVPMQPVHRISTGQQGLRALVHRAFGIAEDDRKPRRLDI